MIYIISQFLFNCIRNNVCKYSNNIKVDSPYLCNGLLFAKLYLVIFKGSHLYKRMGEITRYRNFQLI